VVSESFNKRSFYFVYFQKGTNMNIFISYSNEDKAKLNCIVKKLKKDKTLNPIVVANTRLPLKELTDKVANNLQKSEILLPILTDNSIKNQWVNQEIGYAIAAKKKIIPIVQKSIMKDLKGFINSQVDLPYFFESYPSNQRRESILFSKCCDILLKDIISANSVYNNYQLSTSILNGSWEHTWEGHFGIVRIRNNDYVFEGDRGSNLNRKAEYRIENVNLDSANNQIEFDLIQKWDGKLDANQKLKIINQDLMKGYAADNPQKERMYKRIFSTV
jgi:hypothetical protein